MAPWQVGLNLLVFEFRILYYMSLSGYVPMAKFLLTENDLTKAFRKIPDGSVVAISGFNISTAPEYLLLRLYDTFLKYGHPRHLFIESDSLPGSPGRGIDKVCSQIEEEKHYNFLKGILMPFLGWSPALQKLVLDERIEGYTLSIGTMAHLLREISAGRPGLITKVGVGTFLDAKQDSGTLNELARKVGRVSVENMVIHGKDYLLISAPKPNVALIRGTTADEMGNISMEKEGIYGTVFTITQASKAGPDQGMTFCQVERVARLGTINPKAVHIPGPLIDYVAVSPAEYAWQTGSIEFDPRISGGLIPPLAHKHREKIELDARTVIERRAAIEIARTVSEKKRAIIANFGVGIPSEIPSLLDAERISDYIYSTVEAGPWGGVPLTGNDFGVSIGPFAIIPLPDQFTLYEGGMIDISILGFMQVDAEGNVNPSILPGRIPGPGGFPAITCGSPSIVFTGQFSAGKPDIRIHDGNVTIAREGDTTKFVKQVYKIFFRGEVGVKENKKVTFITERAVFKLGNHGIELTEIAPGVDMDRDILDRMEFKPVVNSHPQIMDSSIFLPERLGLTSYVSGIKKNGFEE